MGGAVESSPMAQKSFAEILVREFPLREVIDRHVTNLTAPSFSLTLLLGGDACLTFATIAWLLGIARRIRMTDSHLFPKPAADGRIDSDAMPALILAIALACGIWFSFILLVQAIGTTQLYRHYSSNPKQAVSPNLEPGKIPHVTILRPVKGLEPQLYECLAATFRQTYPRESLTIYFCIPSINDSAFPVLQHLLKDFPGFDVKVLIEEEDPNLPGRGGSKNLGPNPKIRNLSRGYREAKGDIVWIIDSNVWVSPGVAARMVDKLCGFRENGRSAVPYKFVHQLPLVVDNVCGNAAEETRALLQQPFDVQASSSSPNHDSPSAVAGESNFEAITRHGGGRLEEMFMASSHAKFYTAINTVGVAPCIVGKSNMFRKSHLDSLTSDTSPYSPGIDYFSENICEDHLIGDLLWRKKVPEEKAGQKYNKHGLVFGDLAIQPMASMSVQEYIGRRVRWLRVRKWTVPVATFVEPGVEPLLCSAYGSFALTTLPWSHDYLGTPQTWTAFVLIWLSIVLSWMFLDSFVYAKLHSGASVELDSNTPSFARPHQKHGRRPPEEWVMAWLSRESLALYIWTRALCGATVAWRGKTFKVRLDMKVVEVNPVAKGVATPEIESARSRSKDRLD